MRFLESEKAKISLYVIIIAASAPFLYCLLIRLWALGTENPFLQTFLASTFIGTIAYYGRWIFNQAWHRAWQYFTVSVTVNSRDANFEAILKYITESCELQTTRWIGKTKKQDLKWWERWQGVRGAKPELEYLPKNGSTTDKITYKNHNIYIHRSEPKILTGGFNLDVQFYEEITLYFFTWGNSTKIIHELLADAIDDAYKIDSNETSVYVIGGWWGWSKACKKKQRGVDSVILDSNIADELISDAKQFLTNGEWYTKTGIPYRRGYLFHGPPGCGKTSFAQVFAGSLDLDICVLNLSDDSLDDTKLNKLLREAPASSLILLEDVDSVFVERKINKDGKNVSVSFSGLLNALDGVASQEGRIYVLTTNHVDRLDEALIRPGRCDYKVHIRKASRMQIRKLFKRFYPEADRRLVDEFALACPNYELSMAQIQGHLMKHRLNVQSAIDCVDQFLDNVKLHSKEKVVKVLSIYDHLKRLNLHHWAWLFEFHGYHKTDDLKRLKLDQIKKWTLDFRLEINGWDRLTSLFKDELPKEYRLADYLDVINVFNEKFYQTGKTEEEVVEFENLLEEFTAIVCPRKKSLISNYQLADFLSRYTDPTEAVKNIREIVTPRTDYQCHWPKAWDLACRLCYFHVTREKLQEKKIEFVHELLLLQEKEWLEIFGQDNKRVIVSILKGERQAKQDILYRNYSLLCFKDAVNLCKTFYSDESEELILEFAKSVTNIYNVGYVSMLQASNYLQQKKEECACLKTVIDAIDELLYPEEIEEETVVECWMHNFLIENGFEKYWNNFKKQGFTDIDPKREVTEGTLKELGITVMCDKWKLLDLFGEIFKEMKEQKETENKEENDTQSEESCEVNAVSQNILA